MLIDIVKQIPLIEQTLPNFVCLAIPLLGITLQKAAKSKARYLVNNLPKKELTDLKIQVDNALSQERRALIYKAIPFTKEIAKNACMAKMVQTKIISASKKRNEGKKGKQKIRKYMQGL